MMKYGARNMKITILNGNPNSQNQDFETYLADLTHLLVANAHEVTSCTLRELHLHYCTGCFGCWVKIPGECVVADDSAQVRRSVINSDFTLLASPLRMGFPSALLKQTMDKLIPLIHPYAVVDHGEAHHLARYENYPRLGLLLQKETDTDDADIEIITSIFARTSLNLKSRLEFSMLTTQTVEQVARAIATPVSAAELFKVHLKPSVGTRVALPQHLTVFNGSPRGQKGNTPLMLEQFLKGFASLPGRTYEVLHLSHLQDTERFQQAYTEAECVLIGFPLYTDAMPGIVKAFIELLEPYRGRNGNPPMGFLVQSGFPEAVHSRHVERYLEKLGDRLHAPYLGTIVKGGGEGTREMPENMTKKLFDSLYELGKNFAETGQFDPTMLKALAKPEKFPAILSPVFKLLLKMKIASSYWDGQMKENGVFEKRFARPYMGDK
jgi:multimeric flavodoxin WrbA